MVRIYGSGVPGGDVEDDSFGARQAAEHDAELDTAREAVSWNAAGADASPSDAEVIADTEEFRAEALSRFEGRVFGDDFALVLAVKGGPDGGQGDNGFLESALGEALRKSMESLGYDPWALGGVWIGGDGSDGMMDPRTLRSIIELIDPVSVVAVDATAGRVLLRAYSDQGVGDGQAVASGAYPSPERLDAEDLAATVCGRRHVFLRDFEASLDDIELKRSAWMALRSIKR